MKICFLARPTFDLYSAALYKELTKKDPGIEGVFITTNGEESRKIIELLDGYHNIEVFETSTYLKEHWKDFNLGTLVQYEKEYDCKPIWELIYTDRFLINRDYDYSIKVCSGLFSFYQYVYRKTHPDFYYSECIATLQCYIGYIVGKKEGVQYITQMCARGSLDSSYHYFSMDPFEYDIDLNKNYLQTEYRKDEIKRASEYLDEFENKDLKPLATNLVNTKPKIDKNFILAPLRYLKRRADPNLNDPYSYMYYKSYEDLLNPIRFYFRYQKLKHYCQEPDYSRKYIYFPLHYQPEATTCVCAEKYEKQLFFIDSWAKSLPADTVLYLKEHFTLLGHRDLQFYKELRKYPNVFLVDPLEDSRKLIRNAAAVTTLAGTAGLEAMLLRKPVFLGGNAVYEDAPGIIKVTDIYGQYVSLIEKWQKPAREDIIKYLCACFRSYYPGNIYCQNFSQLLQDNVPDIANSLFEKLIVETGKDERTSIDV